LLRAAWAFEQGLGFDPIPRGEAAAPPPARSGDEREVGV
jgi:hypothetical protein